MQNPPVRRARWFRTPGGGGGTGGDRAIMFELAAPLDPTDLSVQAYPRPWNRALQRYVTDYTAATFAVYDYIYRFRGRGKGDMESPDDFGSRGLSVRRDGLFVIEYLDEHATGIKCTVDGDYTGGDIPVDNVVVTKPIKVALLMAKVLSVVKRHNWDADRIENGAVITAEWDDVLERMVAIMPDCATII